MRNTIIIFFILLQEMSFSQTISSQIDSVAHYCYKHFSFEGVILVADNNKIVYTKAIGDANKEWKIKNSLETKFRLGSISKQFAAYILFALVQEGKLSWEDKVCKWLPQFCEGEKAGISISNLVHHTSGLRDYSVMKEFADEKFYPKDSIVKLIAKAPMNFAPGTYYAYSNSNFYLAGIIAEKVSGLSFDSLLMKKILMPAGMPHTGLDHEGLVLENRATAYQHVNGKTYTAPYLNMESVFTGGGMYATANDLLNWSRFFQKQLAANNSLRTLLQTSLAGSDSNLYSSGWCILPNELVHTGHINGFANLISIDTAHHRTIIILSNNDYQKLYIIQETITSILNKNKNALKWMSTKLSDAEMDQYIGVYKKDNREVITKKENGKLISYVNGRPIELFPLAKDVFFAEEFEGDISFERNKNNEVIAAKSFQNYSFLKLIKIK
jgi:CubicO group peptidase (beta-lactamase class C family)